MLLTWFGLLQSSTAASHNKAFPSPGLEWFPLAGLKEAAESSNLDLLPTHLLPLLVHKNVIISHKNVIISHNNVIFSPNIVIFSHNKVRGF